MAMDNLLDEGKTEVDENNNEEVDEKLELENEEGKETEEENEEGDEKPEKEIKLVDEDEKIDDDDSLIVPARKKEILAKYPKLFKDFPYLEKAYYRDQQFTEIFSTPTEAQEAVDKAEVLDGFEKSLMSGDTTDILGKIKDQDPNAFYKIVDNYLVNLGKVDQKAQYHVIGDVIKRTVSTMMGEGERIKNENLKAAAQILNQFMFGTGDIQSPTQLSRDEDSKLKNEREEFQKERFTTAQGELSTKIENVIKSTIAENIDPKDAMTSYVKKTAIKDALGKLTETIEADDRFTAQIDRLWKDSAKENFSRKSLDKIRSAYLSKARTLLPKVISSTRNEAMKGLGKREDTDRRGPINPGRSSTGKNDGGNGKLEMPKGMSVREFLMKD